MVVSPVFASTVVFGFSIRSTRLKSLTRTRRNSTICLMNIATATQKSSPWDSPLLAKWWSMLTMRRHSWSIVIYFWNRMMTSQFGSIRLTISLAKSVIRKRAVNNGMLFPLSMTPPKLMEMMSPNIYLLVTLPRYHWTLILRCALTMMSASISK